MISRETLKKIRQTEIRTANPVMKPAIPDCVRIPTGFRPKAQGCEERATLGHHQTNIPNRNAVTANLLPSLAREICRNPVGVVRPLTQFTQGSSFLATLGWRMQSLWDWPNRAQSAISNRQLAISP
jgi:hypothetical protein